MKRLRILLADDHALFRDGIASLLRAWQLDLVGEASDGLHAVEQALKLRPDVILMDIQMPRLNGIEATRRIKRDLPETKIVMLRPRAKEAVPRGKATGHQRLRSGVWSEADDVAVVCYRRKAPGVARFSR